MTLANLLIPVLVRPSLAIAICALTACTGSPSVRGHDTVSVQIYSGSDFYLDLKKRRAVVRDQKPGEVAVDVASEMIRDCGSLWEGNSGFGVILAPFCVMSGVAIGATADAIAKGADGEPKQADATLKSAIDTANVHDTVDAWRAMLQASLEEAGRQHGKNVVSYPDGESIYVVVEDLYWAPASGQRWAISGRFEVATQSGDGFARRNFTVSGAPYEIGDWVTSNDGLLADEMQRFFDQAASKAWAIVAR